MGDKSTDNELALRALAGDWGAFAGLVERHHGAVYRLALRMTGSRQDAEDLAQETFLRIHARLGTYDPARPFAQWMYAVGLNLVRDHLKARSRTLPPEFARQTPGPAPEQPDAVLARSQEKRRVGEMLGELPGVLREAVVLRYYMDLSFAEIAQTADISLSSAKMRVYRGLDRLRELMDGAQGSEGEHDEH